MPFVSQCIHMLESHEDDITQWYLSSQKENLMDWLCVERILDENEQGTYCFQLPNLEIIVYE